MAYHSIRCIREQVQHSVRPNQHHHHVNKLPIIFCGCFSLDASLRAAVAGLIRTLTETESDKWIMLLQLIHHLMRLRLAACY